MQSVTQPFQTFIHAHGASCEHRLHGQLCNLRRHLPKLRSLDFIVRLRRTALKLDSISGD